MLINRSFCTSMDTKAPETGLPEPGIISKEKLVELMKDEKAKFTLVDVREKHELSHGMLPNAVHVPLGIVQSTFGSNTRGNISADYDVPMPELDDQVIMYCRSGIRSNKAAHELIRQGYTNVFDYSGGYIDWFGKTY